MTPLFPPLQRMCMVGFLLSLFVTGCGMTSNPAVTTTNNTDKSDKSDKSDTPNMKQHSLTQWQNRKFGMFIHFGLYSELGGVWDDKPVTKGYSEQIQMWGKIPDQKYQAIAKSFNPSKFDPDAICQLAKDAGMKFIVITTKHHDGFSMYHTKLSKYNIVDATPYRKDVIKQLADACKKHGLKFGIYFSLVDWHQGHQPDPNNNNPVSKHIEDFTVGQLEELLTHYGPICEVWFDMSNPTYAQSKRFADTVRKLQPNTMISGRIWNNQGDFVVMGDNHVPNVRVDQPWQTPASIYNATWGYRSWQKPTDLKNKIKQKTRALIKVASLGGNYLLNIGPRGDGSVVAYEADVLKGIGQWLKRNGHGESIYNTQAQPWKKLSWGWCTVKSGKLYLHIFDWPADGKLVVPGVKNKITKITLLSDASKTPVPFNKHANDLIIQLPDQTPDPIATVVAVEYAGKLNIIPQNLVKPDADGTTLLTDKNATTSKRIAGGNYYDQKWYNVARSWNFQIAKSGDYEIQINYANLKKQRKYTINLNGQTQSIALSPTSTTPVTRTITNVHLNTNAINLLTIKLANPTVNYEDLGLKIHNIKLINK